MISSEVQRTLVKSPPELWAELSDPAALARHLGELGDIRIVRTEPESTVEWATENTTGTVSIKASGWGTKVTLSVTRETPEATPAPEADAPAVDAATQPERPPEREPAAIAGGAGTGAPEPTAPLTKVEPEPALEGVTPPEPRSEPNAATAPAPKSEPETASAPVPKSEPKLATAPDPVRESEPRRGLFARLFGRRRGSPSGPANQNLAVVPADPPPEEEPTLRVSAAPDAFAAVREVLAPESFASEHPFVAAAEIKAPDPEPTATAPDPTVSQAKDAAREAEASADREQSGDLSAELKAAEETDAEEVTAVLTAVLDRLGAAHHRPFSRS